MTEAGPQNHSDDPFDEMARAVLFILPPTDYWRHVVLDVAAALRSVDTAAREECARIAARVDFEIDPTREPIEHEIVTVKILRAIRQSIKP